MSYEVRLKSETAGEETIGPFATEELAVAESQHRMDCGGYTINYVAKVGVEIPMTRQNRVDANTIDQNMDLQARQAGSQQLGGQRAADMREALTPHPGQPPNPRRQ